jgi:transcriptional regulator with XRE-family HTH domain
MIYDGKKITALREGRGWNMAELARRSRLSQPTLWELEHQITKKPKYETLTSIAAALGVPVQAILNSSKKGGDKEPDLDSQMAAAFAGLSAESKRALIAAAEHLTKQGK